jgi:hypothetical protein
MQVLLGREVLADREVSPVGISKLTVRTASI